MDSVEEKKAKMTAEITALIDWSVTEGDKVVAQLKQEGAIMGLDCHQERFAYIRETKKQRLKEIIDRYNLPLDTKLQLV